MWKKLSLLNLLCSLLGLIACDDDSVSPQPVAPDLGILHFVNWKIDSTDETFHTIYVSPQKAWQDSIVIDSAEAKGGASLYLTADADLYNPELGEELVSKTSISTVDTTNFSIVVLDDKNRVVAVWLIVWPAHPAPSSSSFVASETWQSSSSDEIESSSSKKEDPISDVQLLGSDFANREDAFWGTTSDAMATEGSFKVVANYTFTSTRNLAENGNSITLSSRVVSCAWAGIAGGKKLATGIYFAGSYAGQDAMNIYDVNYRGGTPSTDESDISSQLTFGRPFSARPTAFELTYSYEHVAGKNSKYPQKGLAYVILVSEDLKAVAVGGLIWEASESNTSTVELSYGADPAQILSAGYVGTSDLILGTGEEGVTSIRVVFASSAYAHIVAGGTTVLNEPSLNYRGGEGSSLTLENFKLLYK